jgi:hypothetical protein
MASAFRGSGRSVTLLCSCLLLVGLTFCLPAWAGPVDWREVPATSEGRQWWDAGSLRRDRDGNLSVLSRYTTETDPDTPSLGTLVVMQIDCGQKLYRDQQVNGLPRWGARWEAAGDDALINRVIEAVCSSAPA